ncbi:pilus assembly protein PilX [Geomonas terrae]|uniref:Pilus assembly protein PilX n=1 Tax=Geomonas terrae TaxID=2562681 RepID=A0A4S1CBE9_9BACT|nr:pilus assembly protein PilX [Geomonas terrae]TGU70657.1 pilus assembly protein PilX [Geomonas terrae]
MRYLGSQHGAALVTALMLTALSLVIAVALLTMVTTGIQTSASQKRYRSSLSAARGAVDLFTQELMPRLFQAETSVGNLEHEFSGIELHVNLDTCLRQKLTLAPGSWTGCSAAQASSDPAAAPDVTFRLAGPPAAQGFTVSTKIVDTVPGNTDRSGYDLLDAAGAVAAQDEVVRPQHVPAMYHLAVQGSRDGQTRERARLSVLYAY